MIKFFSKMFRRPVVETKTSEVVYQQVAAQARRKLAGPMAINTRLDDRIPPTLQPLATAMNTVSRPRTVKQAREALDRAKADLLEAQLRQSYGYEREL